MPGVGVMMPFWFGARWRAITLHPKWSLGPSLRLALPSTQGSLPLRVESGWAAAGRLGRISLLGNLGIRLARNDRDHRALVPAHLASAAFGLVMTSRGTHGERQETAFYSVMEFIDGQGVGTLARHHPRVADDG